MDALLKYLLERISISLLVTELAIMMLCVLAIIVIKCITKVITGNRNRIQDKLSDLIEQHLVQEKNLDDLVIPPIMRQYRNLVEVLEKFDHRFNDLRWLGIKDKINSSYLLPRASRFASSYSWVKRQLAARSCLLSPHLANTAVVSKLLGDARYLVRVAAAVCVTKMSSQELFFRVIKMMSEETSLAQFPYRDALIQVNEEKYEWIASLLSTVADNKIRAICLDILTARYSSGLFSLVKPFMNSEHRPCRLLAIKALGSIHSEEAIEILIGHLDDSEWEIRAESIIAMQKLYVTRTIPRIKKLLHDPIWWVRLQAALALKNFGQKGIDILTSEDLKEEPKAYEIAQYALALPQS